MSARRCVLSIVGTRPNFMKIGPVTRALGRHPDEFSQVLVHTGQHYDDEMSRVFLEELGLGAPDHFLGVGSGSHSQQTARVLERLEPVLQAVRPDLVLVPGDVNSTLAAALCAAKLGFRVGHVEAGLRSFDRTMPEELNRILTDQLSELLFTHSPEAKRNLLAEGADPKAIHYVGNSMIDTLVAMRGRIESQAMALRLGLQPGGYLVVTLHRPGLVDGPLLEDALAQLERIASDLPVVFPVHPRTHRAMAARDLAPGGLRLLGPIGYVEFLSLVTTAAGVLTDSGGIQEETTYLGVPCFTLRSNTERPITCEHGTNTVLGLDPARIADLPARVAEARTRPARVPPLWDGRAAERIVAVLRSEDRLQEAVEDLPPDRAPAGGSLR